MIATGPAVCCAARLAGSAVSLALPSLTGTVVGTAVVSVWPSELVVVIVASLLVTAIVELTTELIVELTTVDRVLDPDSVADPEVVVTTEVSVVVETLPELLVPVTDGSSVEKTVVEPRVLVMTSVRVDTISSVVTATLLVTPSEPVEPAPVAGPVVEAVAKTVVEAETVALAVLLGRPEIATPASAQYWAP